MALSSRRPPTAPSLPVSPARASSRLLAGAGFEVVETSLTLADFEGADEIFTSGNYSKVVPVTRLESRDLQPGPIAAKAKDLYMDWAHSVPSDF